MQASPLQLKLYFLRELTFSLKGDFMKVPGKTSFDSIELVVEVETERMKDGPRSWRCGLVVKSRDEEGRRAPYSFQVEYVGFFEVDAKYPEDRVELMVKTNAPALLYSAARETLLPLTARGPSPALILPSVTFLQPQPTEETSPQAKHRPKISEAAVKRSAKK